MKPSFAKPSAWKIALSVIIAVWLLAGAALSGRVWYEHSLVQLQWLLVRATYLLFVFAAPWFGAWGKASTPCSPAFLALLRASAVAVYLAETLSVFAYAPLPAAAVWIPISTALLLAELVAAMFTLAFRTIGLSPRLAPHARQVVWGAALSAWLLRIGLDCVMPPAWEGPAVLLRPLAAVLVGSQPAAIPLAGLACAVLAVHLAARFVGSRLAAAAPSPVLPQA